MSNSEQTGKGISPGAALVRMRWDKTTEAERLEVGRNLTKSRLEKRKGKKTRRK